MKMTVTRTPIATGSPIPLDAAKEQCQVDFPDDDLLIQQMVSAAALDVEHFAQVALLDQTINVEIIAPARCDLLALPIGPVASDASVTVTIDGAAFTEFELVAGIRPHLRWLDLYHRLTPDRVVIEYPAGFSPDAANVPRDLAQAVADQAALLYGSRSPVNAKEITSSPHMARVAARYRGVSV